MKNPIYDESFDSKWEDGEYGLDENFVQVATIDQELSAELDKALKLTPISIRLQDELVADLKEIAAIHGIGYQPMIRQLLQRFVVAEKKILAMRNNAMQIKIGCDDEDEPLQSQHEPRVRVA